MQLIMSLHYYGLQLFWFMKCLKMEWILPVDWDWKLFNMKVPKILSGVEDTVFAIRADNQHSKFFLVYCVVLMKNYTMILRIHCKMILVILSMMEQNMSQVDTWNMSLWTTSVTFIRFQGLKCLLLVRLYFFHLCLSLQPPSPMWKSIMK